MVPRPINEGSVFSKLFGLGLGIGGLAIAGYHLVFTAAPPYISGWGGKVLTGMQLLLMATSYSAQAGSSPTPYSKFAAKATDGTKVSSRIAMLIIYTPALLTSAYFLLPSLSAASAASKLSELPLTVSLCFVHFLKRDLETLFLHKYSGSIQLGLSCVIGTFYALVAALCCSVSTATTISLAQRHLAIGLFALGALGNLYHHWLLANLRASPSSASKYVAPSGGLFSVVAAPHYLFELIAWLGVAVSANHTNAFLVFGGMLSYLAGRAVAQNRFNREKFGSEWPASRKCMLPMLF